MTGNPHPVPSLCWRCQRRPAIRGERCETCEKQAEAVRRDEGRLVPGDAGFVATNDIERARHRRRLRERRLSSVLESERSE